MALKKIMQGLLTKEKTVCFCLRGVSWTSSSSSGSSGASALANFLKALDDILDLVKRSRKTISCGAAVM